MARRFRFESDTSQLNLDLATLYPDASEALTVASSYLFEKTKQRFLAEVDPNGRPWAPHARDYGNPILYRTGKLFNSLYIDQSGRLRHTLSWDKSKAPYGVYHMSGTRYMPARPFIGISRDDEREIEKRITTLFRNRAGG